MEATYNPWGAAGGYDLSVFEASFSNNDSGPNAQRQQSPVSPTGSGPLDNEDEGDTPATRGRRRLPPEAELSKRRAQNRAAQRTFRQRKHRQIQMLNARNRELEETYKRLKEENARHLATIEEMSLELELYKEQLSRSCRQLASAPPLKVHRKDIDFRFEFPKFGNLLKSSAKYSVGSNIDAQEEAAYKPLGNENPLDNQSVAQSSVISQTSVQGDGSPRPNWPQPHELDIDVMLGLLFNPQSNFASTENL